MHKTYWLNFSNPKCKESLQHRHDHAPNRGRRYRLPSRPAYQRIGFLIVALLITLSLGGPLFVQEAQAASEMQPLPPPPAPTPTPPPIDIPPPGMPYPGYPPMPIPEPPDFCSGTAVVTGQVVDPAGLPIAGAFVLANSADGYEFCASEPTNESGEFLLSGVAAGEWTLMAQPDSSISAGLYESAATSLSVAEEANIVLAEPLTLQFAHATGTFLQVDGSPAMYASGYISPAQNGECPDAWDPYSEYPVYPTEPTFSEDEFRYVYANENGVWGTVGLTTQVYCLYLNSDWYGMDGNTVSIAPEPLLFDFDASMYGGALAPLELGSMQYSAPPKRIEGVVVDDDGNPAAGIQVEASSMTNYGWASATTNENGEFVLTVSGGEWNIYAHTNHGYYPGAGDGSSAIVIFADDTSEEVQSVQLTIALPSGTITGSVVAPDGSPIVNAVDSIYIYLTADSYDSAGPDYGYYETSATIDENGLFTAYVFPGEYTLHVDIYHPDYAGYFGPTINGIVVGEDEVVDLGAVALSGPQLTARVVRPDGTPVPYVDFSIYPRFESDCLDMVGSMPPVPAVGPVPEYGYGSYYAATNEQGILTAGGLTAGDYCLSLSQPWDESGLFPPEPLAFTLTDVADVLDLGDIGLIVPPKEIVAKVMDESGTAIADAEVSAYNVSGSGYTYTRTDANGLGAVNVTGGVWEVSVYPSTYGYGEYWYDSPSKTVVFEEDDTPETETISFTVKTPNSAFNGRLLDVAGNPISGDGAWIEFYSLDGFGTSAQVAADGTFSVQVISGIYEIYISIYDETLLSSGYLPEQPPAEIGANEVVDLGDIQLVAKTAIISGVVLQDDQTPVANAVLNAWSYDQGYEWGYGGDWSYATTNASGAYSLTVRGGEYEVMVQQNEPGTYFVLDPPKQVTAVDNETVTVNHTVYGAAATVDIKVVDRDGNLLTDVYATAYARRAGSDSYPVEPLPADGVTAQGGIGYGYYGPFDEIANARIFNGVAEMNLPKGDYQIGLYLDYGNNDYTFMEQVSTTIESEVNASGITSVRGRMVDLLSANQSDVTAANSAQPVEIQLAGEERITVVANPDTPLRHYGLPASNTRLPGRNAHNGALFGDSPSPDPLPRIAVDVVLEANDATIAGHLRNPDNEIVTDIYGEVNLWAGMYGDAWSYAPINPNTGHYETVVAPGIWNIDYYLQTEDYVSYSQGGVQVEAVSEQTTTHDIQLQPLNGIIQGTVLNADGEPVQYGYVWANSFVEEPIDGDPSDTEPLPLGYYGGHYAGAEIVDGQFTLKVLPGKTYEVGADNYWDDEFGQAPTQLVVVQADAPTQITIQFVRPDATITVTAYRVDQSADGQSTQELAPYAYVSAWSDNGQHSYAQADENGQAILPAYSGSVWHLYGDWHPGTGYQYYHSAEEVSINVTTAGNVATDLLLTLNGTPLPETLSESLDVAEAWTASLGDGTRISIPANAIPVTDQEGDDATITIEPRVGLPNTLLAKTVDYGYDIKITERQTGTPVRRNLNLDATLTLFYTDEELAKLNITEDEIAPAYFSDTENTWKKADNFTVDTANNRVTVQMNQAANWALVVPGATSADGTSAPGLAPAVYVPLMQ